jgi:hypothetical protein
MSRHVEIHNQGIKLVSSDGLNRLITILRLPYLKPHAFGPARENAPEVGIVIGDQDPTKSLFTCICSSHILPI